MTLALPPPVSGTTETGPLALVTGAAGIIGPALVKGLREQGWRVAATDRDEESFAFHTKAFGAPLEADGIFFAGLDGQKGCQSLIAEVEAALGPITAIVNNAAGGFLAPARDVQESDLQRALAVNFAAPVFLAQAALPSLIREKGGIVNISSVLVSELRQGRLAYSCSKAALEKATEIMAFEWGVSGVRINTVRVGRVLGIALFRQAIAQLPPVLARKMVHDLHPKRVKFLRSIIGDQALGTPGDVAHAVAFLLSPASRFVQGQTLTLDGGHRPGTDAGPPVSAEFDAKLIAQWMADHGQEAAA